VQHYALADPQSADNSNLNRLVGATLADAASETPKVAIAHRLITQLNPQSCVDVIRDRWQAESAKLIHCSVIFGCVDSFSEREQLERFCRRFLIPYIDVGMDVIQYEDEFRIVGQVAQSFPGAPCLRCMGIINEHILKREADNYGSAGPQPQVVWANGVLASTAVSLFVRLFTDWGPKQELVYLEYNGNDSCMAESPRLRHVRKESCSHYEQGSLGDPLFDIASTIRESGAKGVDGVFSPPTNWSDYVAHAPVASPEFMENVEDLPMQ